MCVAASTLPDWQDCAVSELHEHEGCLIGGRCLVQVIMSETQRRMVESVLSNLRGEQGGGSDGTAASAGDAVNVDMAAARLEVLGFTHKDVAAAVAAVAATQEGGRLSLPAALDWLCIHVPEEHLPAAFAAGNVSHRAMHSPRKMSCECSARWSLHLALRRSACAGSSGQVVGVIVPQGQVGARRQASGNSTADLMAYGYRMEEAAAALQASKGDQETAFARLYSRLIGKDSVSLHLRIVSIAFSACHRHANVAALLM